MKNSPMKNLLKLIALDITGIESVCRTSDGIYLGMHEGDIGYNLVLGRPARPNERPDSSGIDYTLDVWDSFTSKERVEVEHLAANMPDGTPIPLLEEFGVPVGTRKEGK